MIPFPRPTLLLAGLLLLVLLAVLLSHHLRTPRTVVTYYVSQLDGSDARTCSQATSVSAPKASINGGIACLQGGQRLVISAGTYNELLMSQTSSSMTCSSGDIAVQSNCAPIPNGRSSTEPTILQASGPGVILSPVGKAWPGGGSAINLMDYARFVHIEGIEVVKSSAAGSASGIYIGNAQHITLKGNTLNNGQIKGGMTSRYLSILGNRIFDTGKDTCPTGVKPVPNGCPHGMYICGTDHVISDNRVENSSYYSIQVSCESGGIARIKLERNTIIGSGGVGIRCAGEDCLIASNVLVDNAQAITTTGSGVVSNNVIDGYLAATWNPDPTGIWSTWGDGSGFTITNNIFTRQKNAYLTIGNVENRPPNTSTTHHNLGETSGNAGVTIIAPGTDVFVDIEKRDYRLQAGSPAIKAGVVQSQVTTDITGAAYPTPPDLGAYSSTGTAPPPQTDTTKPTVRMANPPNNEQVFGPSLPLIATASDNVGVVSVLFQIDGTAVGEPDVSIPYEVIWDTTLVGNGPHTITATARDAADNASSNSITVRVDNPTAPEPPGQAVLSCAGTIAGTTFAMECTKPVAR